MPLPWSSPLRRFLSARITWRRTPSPRGTRSCALRLEGLEDRLVPASHTWTGAVDGNWSTPGNWTGGAPAVGESNAALVFPAGAAHVSTTDDIPGLALQSVTFQAGGSPALAYALGGASFTVSGGLLVGAGTTGAVSIANDIGGAGSVTQSGGGTLTLSGNNTYSGGTSLNAGGLVAGSATAFGTVTVGLHAGTLSAAVPLALASNFAVQGVVTLGGATDLTLSGNVALDSSSTLTIQNSATTTLAGNTPGSGSLVVDAGAGTVVETAENTIFTGQTTLKSGTLAVGSGSALGGGGTATLNLAGGTLRSDGASALVVPVSVTAPSTVGGSLDLSFLLPVNLNSSLTVTSSGQTTFQGAIGGTGSLIQAGTGSVFLSGNNSYSGGTTLRSGTLFVFFNSGLGSGPVSLQGGTFQSNGITTTNPFLVNGPVDFDGSRDMFFGGPITLSGVPTLTVSNTGLTGIDGSITGPGSLVLTPDAGTLVLAATNGYAGATVLDGGLLRLAAPGAIPPFSPLSVAAGATLDLSGFDASVTDLSGAGLVNLDAATLTAGVAGFASFTGTLSGTGGLLKVGPGALELAGVGAYTGPTTVAEGSLLVDTAAVGTPVTVMGGGVLGGTGSVGSITLQGGVLSPGHSPGILTSNGNVTFDVSSSYNVDIDAYLPGTGYDQLRVVNGQVDLRGCKLQTGLKAGFVPVLGDQFTIIQTSQPVLGTFDGLPEGAVVQLNGLAFQITYQGGAGHDVVLTRGVRVGVALQASVTALQVGQPLTLTATVTGPTGAAAPTGMVTFLDGTTSLGSAGLDGNGRASLTVSSLGQGGHNLSASYGSDAVYLARTSSALALAAVLPAADDNQLVAGLYHDLLGRAPQPAELAFFVPVLTAAELPSLPAVAGQFLATPQYRGDVVKGDYDKLLHRAPGPDEVAFWSSGLAQPALGAEWVVATIVSSPEYVQGHAGGDPDPNLAWLGAAYPDLLGRDLGPQDRAFWQQYFQLGITRSTVAYYLATSGEAHAQLVKGWYTTFLQRDAGLADLVFWAGQFAGRTDDQVEALIAGSPEAFQKAGNTNRQWIASLYTNLLGRPADDGVNYFLNILLGGSAAQRQAVVGVLTGSAEYRQHQAALDLTRYLQRDVSGAEAGYFAGLRQAGLTEEQVVAQVVATDEYFQKAGGSDEPWVNQLYRDLLGRAADPGSAYFLQALASGATRDEVAAVILGGGEYQNGLVGRFYSTYLGRAPGAGELAYWTGLLQAGLHDEDILAMLLTSGEYYLRPHAS